MSRKRKGKQSPNSQTSTDVVVYKFSNGTYIGDVNEDGIPNGHGEFLYSNNMKYDGFMKNGERNGMGILSDARKDRIIYNGQWKNDLKDGNGTYFFAGGEKYQGEWKKGKRSGCGAIFFRSGVKRYDGEWKKSKINGYGKYYREDGSLLYDGEFFNGKRNGTGTNYYINKEMYKGEWKLDEIHGEGRYFYDDETIYDGSWEYGLRSGKGRILFKNGDFFEGLFKNDDQCGEGRYYKKNGNEYMNPQMGYWVNNQFIRSFRGGSSVASGSPLMKKVKRKGRTRMRTFSCPPGKSPVAFRKRFLMKKKLEMKGDIDNKNRRNNEEETEGEEDSSMKDGIQPFPKINKGDDNLHIQKIEKLNRMMNCMECREDRKNVVFIPCKHLTSCKDCADLLDPQQCQICGRDIKAKVHVHLVTEEKKENKEGEKVGNTNQNNEMEDSPMTPRTVVFMKPHFM